MSDFDPTQPFEVVGQAGAAPAFDPAQPFEVVGQAPAPQPAPRTAMQEAGRGLGLGARDVIEGLPQFLDMLNNAGAAIANAPSVLANTVAGREVLPEPFRYNVLGDRARGLADSLGLPRPETPTERVLSTAQQGGVSMVLPYGAARAIPALPGAAGQVVDAFRSGPAVDLIAGTAGGAAQGGVQEAGGGEAAGFAANLGGSTAAALVTSAIIAAVARRRGVAPETVRPGTITPEELAGIEPEVLSAYRQQGFGDDEIRRTLEAFRLADLQRARVTPSAVDVQPGASPAGTLAPSPRLAQDFAERSRPPTIEPVSPDRPLPPRRPGDVAPDTLPRQTFRADPADPAQFGPANAPGPGALVPVEPQPNRMTPGDIARAQAEAQGGNPNTAEPPPRLVAPEGRLPQTPDQVQGQREAGQAFTGADRQRERVAPNVRDTQPAGRPEGVNPQPVVVDQGFPVRVISRDGRGFAQVQRFDPRTGEPEPGSVPYVVREADLRQANYAADPRQAQDVSARMRGPRPPEQPRMPEEPVAREPRQTYRATAADPNADFPGAIRPGPEPGQQPPGRSPFPEQPDGPGPYRRWSNAEEAERAFQQRRAEAEAEAWRARESGEWNAGQRSTNRPGAQDADGRWPVAGGYVQSDAGGPIRFGDQRQAARWIIGEGQARSPDQFFEIAVHPSGQGFTVRERGRNPGGRGGREDPSPPPGGAGQAPDGGGASRSSPSLSGADQMRALPPPEPPRSVETPRPVDGPPPREPPVRGAMDRPAEVVPDPAPYDPQARLPATPREATAFIRRAVETNDQPALRSLLQDVERSPEQAVVATRLRQALDYLRSRERGAAPLPADRAPAAPASDAPSLPPPPNPASVLAGDARGMYAEARAIGPDGQPRDVPDAAHAMLYDFGRALNEGRPVDPAVRQRLWEHFRDYVPEDNAAGLRFRSPEDVDALARDYADPFYDAPYKGSVVEPDKLGGYWQRGVQGRDTLSVLAVERIPDEQWVAARAADPQTQQFEATRRRINAEQNGPAPDYWTEQTRKAEEAAQTAEVPVEAKAARRAPRTPTPRQQGMAARDEAARRIREAADQNATLGDAADAYTARAKPPKAEAGDVRTAFVRGAADQAEGNALDRLREGARASFNMMSPEGRAAAAAAQKPPSKVEIIRSENNILDRANIDRNAGPTTRGRALDAYEAGVRYAQENPGAVRRFDVATETARGRQTRYSFVDSGNARATADQISRMPGQTFYSNPLGDPEAWRRFVGEPLRRAFSGTLQKGTSAVRTLSDYAGALVNSSDGQQRMLAARYGESAPTYTRILDMLHATAGEGRAVGRTFSEDVSMRANQRVVEIEKLSTAIKQDGLTPEQVVQAVVFPGRNRDPRVGRHADAVRAILRDELRYMRDAGVEVGDQGRTYFPRDFDVDAVLKDERGFLARTAAEYMRPDGPNLPRAEAEKAAAALLTDIRLGDTPRIGGEAPGFGMGSFTRERKFAPGAEADSRLGRYYAQQDMESALVSYVGRATKRAEIARRFGDRFKGWDDLRKQLLDEGVSAEDITSLQQHVEVATGVNHANMSRDMQNALGVARTLATMGQLDQSVIINLSELLMAGVRTGRLDDSMAALGRGLNQWQREIRGLPREGAAELAESMGIIAGHGHNAIMAARFAAGDPTGRWQEKQLAAFFKRIGLEQLTNATRSAATHAGHVFLDRLAAGVRGESSLTSPQRARFFLRELGVPDDQATAFARFMQAQGDRPLGGDAPAAGPMAEVYQTALARFVDQTVMRPDATTRPKWAAHPVGAAIFTLNSYAYAFTKNVLYRALKLAKEGATGQGYTPIDRVAFMAPMMLTLPVFAAGQIALQQLRTAAMGDPERENRKTDTARAEDMVKQSGVLGGAQMWLDIASSAAFGKDTATGSAGPVFGLGLSFLDTLGKWAFDNSPRTQTAERNLARDAYRTFVEPGANAALGMVPGGGVAGAAARTAATYAIGARPTQEAFVDVVAGPNDPATQRRQRRTPIRGVTERLMEGR